MCVYASVSVSVFLLLMDFQRAREKGGSVFFATEQAIIK